MIEKRNFTRIFFSTPAHLKLHNKLFKTTLVDLSLKGALVDNHTNEALTIGEHCTLLFNLPDSDISINMQGEISHMEKQQIGIKCNQIDLDSVSHLKRLISLNLGDEAMLDRELTHLSSPD